MILHEYVGHSAKTKGQLANCHQCWNGENVETQFFERRLLLISFSQKSNILTDDI